MSFPGYFIVLEGPECSGKTSSAKLLKERIEAMGNEVVLLLSHHDGEDKLAYQQRLLLLHPVIGASMSPTTQALCFAAARRSMRDNTILPALERGAVVIMDRWVYSTIAIQRDTQMLDEINKIATGGLIPNFTFVLDITPETTMQRLGARMGQQDILDMVSLEEHRKRREMYLDGNIYLNYLETDVYDTNWHLATLNSEIQSIPELVESMLRSIAPVLEAA